MRGVNLALFDFDYDLTWMSFFMDAEGRIYSRYGGRDNQSADGRLSAAGLLRTMNEVLRVHATETAKKLPAPKPLAIRKPEEIPGILDQLNGELERFQTEMEAFLKEAA